VAADHPAQSLLFGSAPQRTNRGKGPDIIGNILASRDDPGSHEELRVALEAVTLLPEDERKIPLLACPGGLTYQELAARFARADGTMKSSLRRARPSLAHSLAVVKKPPGRKRRSDPPLRAGSGSQVDVAANQTAQPEPASATTKTPAIVTRLDQASRPLTVGARGLASAPRKSVGEMRAALSMMYLTIPSHRALRRRGP
jgi:hypothetical protein